MFEDCTSHSSVSDQKQNEGFVAKCVSNSLTDQCHYLQRNISHFKLR